MKRSELLTKQAAVQAATAELSARIASRKKPELLRHKRAMDRLDLKSRPEVERIDELNLEWAELNKPKYLLPWVTSAATRWVQGNLYRYQENQPAEQSWWLSVVWLRAVSSVSSESRQYWADFRGDQLPWKTILGPVRDDLPDNGWDLYRKIVEERLLERGYIFLEPEE